MTATATTPIAVRPRGWWFDLVLVALFVALSAALASGHLLKLDQDVANWVDQHQPGPLYWTARVLNYLGQGGQVLMSVSIVLAAWLVWRVRSVRPLVVFVAAFVLTYLTIGPLKIWMSRAAPHSTQPTRVELFNHQLPPGEYSVGYPSGHVANALVWYGVIALLISGLLRAYGKPPLAPRLHALIRGLPPAILFGTTTYLAFHWITDSVAGLLLGLVLTRLLARVPWDEVPLPRLRGWERPAGLVTTRRPPASPV
jgi:membrane-associated phospholipid phosphatase